MRRRTDSPPKLVEWLFSLITPDPERLDLFGDYQEYFHEIAQTRGRWLAIAWYLWQLILLLPSSFCHSIKWSFVMIGNYLTLAFRYIRKNRTHTLIKVMGFAVGIACCLLIFFYMQNEWSYDRFHKNIDRIYFMMGEADLGVARIGDYPLGTVAGKLVRDFPEVENATRMKKEEFILKVDEQSLQLTGLAVDPSFLEIFTFPLIYGQNVSALSGHSSMVLSYEISEKLFGQMDPTGKTVSLKVGEEFRDYLVSGVTEPAPPNSNIEFDFLLNAESLDGNALLGETMSIPTLVMLKETRLLSQLKSRFPETLDKDFLKPYEKYDPKGGYDLFPMNVYHMSGDYGTRLFSSLGNRTYQWILSAIALSILLIACINYMNLSVGDLSNRVREVGMRKVLGVRRKEIVFQYFFEAVLICLLSIGLGLLVAYLLLPLFNALVGRHLTLRLFDGAGAGLFLAGLVLVVSALSSIYPALSMSRHSAVEIFKGRVKFTGKNLFSRVLIVLQFSIAVFLIVGTLFLNRQKNFLLSKDLGFEKEKIVNIKLDNITGDVVKNHSIYRAFKNAILQHPEVTHASGSIRSFNRDWFHLFGFELKETKEKFSYNQNQVDVDYLKILQVPLVAGTDFSPEKPYQLKNGVIVNEAFVKKAGIDDPVGMTFGDIFETTSLDALTIVGVVRDFHFESLSHEITPMVLKYNQEEMINNVYVRFTGSIVEAMKTIEGEYNRVAPDIPFRYSFLEDEVREQYETEKRWSHIVSLASVCSVIIACSGLFALTLLVVTRRTKEIGVRKVLGASVASISGTIFKEFFWLVIVANVISWPAAWFGIQRYLENYSYHISISFWVFILAGGLSLFIALFSVGLHAVRAARVNPVESLRYE